jgi:hypothetical protein
MSGGVRSQSAGVPTGGIFRTYNDCPRHRAGNSLGTAVRAGHQSMGDALTGFPYSSFFTLLVIGKPE